MIEIIVAIFGLVFGSFLNVCIVRVPRRESVVSPGSHCPSCRAPIRWHDNIPVLSYVILRGRCRNCGKRISMLYPAVEILTAAVFWFDFAHYGFTPEFIKSVVFAMLMIVLIFTDLRERRIPHRITVPGIALGRVPFSGFSIADRRAGGGADRRWVILRGRRSVLPSSPQGRIGIRRRHADARCRDIPRPPAYPDDDPAGLAVGITDRHPSRDLQLEVPQLSVAVWNLPGHRRDLRQHRRRGAPARLPRMGRVPINERRFSARLKQTSATGRKGTSLFVP